MLKTGDFPGAGGLRRGLALACGLLLIVAAVAGLLGGAARADAHAALVETKPQAGEKLAAGPEAVELRFNERIDARSAEIVVLTSGGATRARGAGEPIAEGTGLRLAVPELGEGHYTVSYRVISADGHPVSGAIVFTVGDPPARLNPGSQDLHEQVGHAHGDSGLSRETFLLYAARFLYYAGLLMTAGLLLWSWHRAAAPVVREEREKWTVLAGQFLLLSAVAYVFFHLLELGRGEPLSEWGRILTETTIGRLYCATLLLSLAAPFLRRTGPAVRTVWAAAALFVEAWSGHAAAFEPLAYSIGLDVLHLAAAALWAGGLGLLAAVWRRERPEAGRFALLFSRYALLSFVALWVTGTLTTLDFLPGPEYLLYTDWGAWLLVKVGLGLAVIAVAAVIRFRLKRGGLPPAGLLGADGALLGAIVLCVGVLTYQNPLPANEPLHFHQMGDDLHVTLRITPNAPGDNRFTVKVWLPENVAEGRPKSVQLRLQPQGRGDVGFIDVPLEPYEDEEFDAYDGFAKSTYRAEGPYLSMRGEWKAQVRVTDGTDTERVRETTFRLY